MYIFEKICIHLEIPQVCFVGQMSLKIMAELLKNAHVLLKRYLPWWQLLPIDSGFKSCVNRVLRLLTYTSFITLCKSKVRICEWAFWDCAAETHALCSSYTKPYNHYRRWKSSAWNFTVSECL